MAGWPWAKVKTEQRAKYCEKTKSCGWDVQVGHYSLDIIISEKKVRVIYREMVTAVCDVRAWICERQCFAKFDSAVFMGYYDALASSL